MVTLCLLLFGNPWSTRPRESVFSQVTRLEWVRMPLPQTLMRCLSQSFRSSDSSWCWHPLRLASVECGTDFNGRSDQLWAPQIPFPRSRLSLRCALNARGPSYTSVRWGKHFWNSGWMQSTKVTASSIPYSGKKSTFSLNGINKVETFEMHVGSLNGLKRSSLSFYCTFSMYGLKYRGSKFVATITFSTTLHQFTSIMWMCTEHVIKQHNVILQSRFILSFNVYFHPLTKSCTSACVTKTS